VRQVRQVRQVRRVRQVAADGPVRSVSIISVMSILKVARMGHPVLRAKARLVESRELKTVALQKLIDDMMETMYEYGGVGLAAPQVHESLRVFVATLDADGKGEAIAVLNPEIAVAGPDIVEGWEGCLSVPEIRGRVPRAQRIKLSAIGRDGKRLEIDAHDFPARVIQHETDHLDGVLFFDRMRSFETLTYMEEFSRYHSRDDDEESG
jgi:peptide deformylase